ncbi:MAG: DUF2807 domain-containing protein [Bacteroidetes bacterium]|nr:DUF2807 domain-containing protein [Bacteroidota bacterium]
MKKVMSKMIFSPFILIVGFIFYSYGCCDIQHGNGKVVTEERSVDSFTGIDIGGAFQVVLKQGDREALTIETDENLLQYITTEVKDGILIISTEKDCIRFEKLKAYITFKTLESMEFSGAVELWSENSLNFNDLSIDASGASEIEMNLTAQKIEMELSGASELTLSGKVNEAIVEASGATEISAENLEIAICRMSMSGAGDARIYVTKELDVEVSGAGTVRYRGEPEKVNTQVSGAGDIEKI